MEIPDWIDPETWEDWTGMRQEKRYPCTERVYRAAVRTLKRFEDEGHDANAILDRAITGGWQGLFKHETTLRAKKRATVTEMTQPLEQRTEEEKARLREGIRLVRGGLR